MEAVLVDRPQFAVAVAILVGAATLMAVGWFKYLARNNETKASSTGTSTVPKVAGGWPFLGHALEFGSNPKAFVEACRKRYGPTFSCQILSSTFVFHDGSQYQDFFRLPESSLSFDESVRRTLAPEFTVGLETLVNQWHIPIIKRQFSVQTLDPYLLRIERQVTRVLQEDGLVVDDVNAGSAAATTDQGMIVDDLERLAWRIIASCSASSFLGDELCQRQDVIDVFINFHHAALGAIQLSNLLPKWLLWLASKAVKRHFDTVKRIVVPEIERRRASLKNGDELPQDMLTVMVKTSHSPDAIAHRVVGGFIFASMITSAGAMTNALYDLAGRQEQWEALVAEQDRVVREHGATISMAALEAMPRLHAFVWESMRLSALPIQQTRVVMKDGIQFGDYILPKGALLAMSGVLVSNGVEQKPSEFLPERFLDEDGKLVSDPEARGFFPFGLAGRHYCPGRHFALAEIKGGLSAILRNYRVSTVSGKVPAYKYTPASTDRIAEPIKFVARK